MSSNVVRAVKSINPIDTGIGIPSQRIRALAGLLHGYLLNQSPEIRSVTDAGVTILAIVVTFVLAVISSRFFETPLVTLGRRFSYRKITRPLDRQPAAMDVGL